MQVMREPLLELRRQAVVDGVTQRLISVMVLVNPYGASGLLLALSAFNCVSVTGRLFNVAWEGAVR